jgi:hypothetical protein
MEEHNWNVVENTVLVLGLVTGGRKNNNPNNNSNNNNYYYYYLEYCDKLLVV